MRYMMMCNECRPSVRTWWSATGSFVSCGVCGVDRKKKKKMINGDGTISVCSLVGCCCWSRSRLVPAEDWLRERPIREWTAAGFGTHDYAFSRSIATRRSAATDTKQVECVKWEGGLKVEKLRAPCARLTPVTSLASCWWWSVEKTRVGLLVIAGGRGSARLPERKQTERQTNSRSRPSPNLYKGRGRACCL